MKVHLLDFVKLLITFKIGLITELVLLNIILTKDTTISTWMWVIFEWIKYKPHHSHSCKLPATLLHKIIITTNTLCVLLIIRMCSWMTASFWCVILCCAKLDSKREYKGIRPHHSVDSVRLCLAVVQMLAVCIYETVGIFFLMIFVTSSGGEILFQPI